MSIKEVGGNAFKIVMGIVVVLIAIPVLIVAVKFAIVTKDWAFPQEEDQVVIDADKGDEHAQILLNEQSKMVSVQRDAEAVRLRIKAHQTDLEVVDAANRDANYIQTQIIVLVTGKNFEDESKLPKFKAGDDVRYYPGRWKLFDGETERWVLVSKTSKSADLAWIPISSLSKQDYRLQGAWIQVTPQHKGGTEAWKIELAKGQESPLLHCIITEQNQGSYIINWDNDNPPMWKIDGSSWQALPSSDSWPQISGPTQFQFNASAGSTSVVVTLIAKTDTQGVYSHE